MASTVKLMPWKFWRHPIKIDVTNNIALYRVIDWLIFLVLNGVLLIFQINMIILILVKINTHKFILAL
jgi:hypothetical protein